MATDNTYPSAQLPAPSARYSFSKEDGCATTRFSSGKARRRNLHNDLRRLVSIQWEFSQRELDLFQGWYGYTLNNGAENFTIDLLLDADDLQNYEVTPVGKIKVSHFGVNYWKVSLQAICIEQKYVSAEVVELFQYWGDTFGEMLTASDPLDLFINTTLPGYFGE
tara:strand:- start:25648 stop:26142 length:495 start_codon:yes stop_codon:yes gene_type:complete